MIQKTQPMRHKTWRFPSMWLCLTQTCPNRAHSPSSVPQYEPTVVSLRHTSDTHTRWNQICNIIIGKCKRFLPTKTNSIAIDWPLTERHVVQESISTIRQLLVLEWWQQCTREHTLHHPLLQDTPTATHDAAPLCSLPTSHN